MRGSARKAWTLLIRDNTPLGSGRRREIRNTTVAVEGVAVVVVEGVEVVVVVRGMGWGGGGGDIAVFSTDTEERQYL